MISSLFRTGPADEQDANRPNQTPGHCYSVRADLFWPLIGLSDRDMLALPVGLLVIQQGSYIQRGLAFAGAFIATIPPLIFYAIFQRKIIAGITTTGMAANK